MLNKKIASEIAVGVILLLAIIIGGIFWLQNKKTVTSSQQTKPVINQQSALVNNEKNQPKLSVTKFSELRELPDLNLVKQREGGAGDVRYFELQSLETSEGKIILMQDNYCDGAGCTPSYYRLLQKGSMFTLLTKYSNSIDGSNGITKSDLNFSATSDMDVSGLNAPEQLQDFKTKAVVKLQKRSFLEGDLFDLKDKKLMFSDNDYNVYAKTENNNSETFYVRSPDGKELLYDLIDSFIYDETGNFKYELEIKWNDGAKHNNSFQIDDSKSDAYSCELGDEYASIIGSSTISENELMVIASDPNGKAIYGFKDEKNPILKVAQKRVAELDSENDSQENHTNPIDLVIFWKDPFGRLIRFVSGDMITGCGGKPVIYLYPTKPMNILVQVEPKGGISKSEPLYENGWNVFAEPNGALTYENQKYPYLFWEGGLGSYEISQKGFVVAKKDVRSFLYERLGKIGLNQQEINDFKDFWLPKMQSAPFYFITFSVNDELNKYAPLNISPKPDTLLRVLMDYKPLEKMISVQEQELPSIERKGFTVVEWGGVLK